MHNVVKHRSTITQNRIQHSLFAKHFRKNVKNLRSILHSNFCHFLPCEHNILWQLRNGSTDEMRNETKSLFFPSNEKPKMNLKPQFSRVCQGPSRESPEFPASTRLLSPALCKPSKCG